MIKVKHKLIHLRYDFKNEGEQRLIIFRSICFFGVWSRVNLEVDVYIRYGSKTISSSSHLVRISLFRHTCKV